MEQPSNREILLRGYHKRCPRCGKGEIFRRWTELHQACPSCGYELQSREGDFWFFIYMSTAFLTGILIVVILLVSPSNILLGQILIGLAGFGVIVLSLPRRKGLAVALDYFQVRRLERNAASGDRPTDKT